MYTKGVQPKGLTPHHWAQKTTGEASGSDPSEVDKTIFLHVFIKTRKKYIIYEILIWLSNCLFP